MNHSPNRNTAILLLSFLLFTYSNYTYGQNLRKPSFMNKILIELDGYGSTNLVDAIDEDSVKYVDRLITFQKGVRLTVENEIINQLPSGLQNDARRILDNYDKQSKKRVLFANNSDARIGRLIEATSNAQNEFRDLLGNEPSVDSQIAGQVLDTINSRLGSMYKMAQTAANLGENINTASDQRKYAKQELFLLIVDDPEVQSLFQFSDDENRIINNVRRSGSNTKITHWNVNPATGQLESSTTPAEILFADRAYGELMNGLQLKTPYKHESPYPRNFRDDQKISESEEIVNSPISSNSSSSSASTLPQTAETEAPSPIQAIPINFELGVGPQQILPQAESENVIYDEPSYVRFRDQNGTLVGDDISQVNKNQTGTRNNLSWGRWSGIVNRGSEYEKRTYNREGYWIAGQLTPKSGFPKTGSANYNGDVAGTAVATNYSSDYHIIEQEALEVEGNFSITANFENYSVSGGFKNMRLKGGQFSDQLWANQLQLSNSETNEENSFEFGFYSELTHPNIQSDPGQGDFAWGYLDGWFFGDSAQELGGTWFYYGPTSNGWVASGEGIFHGSKQ